MVATSSLLSVVVALVLVPSTLSASLRRDLAAMEYQAMMSLPPPKCPIENGFDYVGNDVANVPGAVDTCCTACANEPRCNAWSWSNHNGGTCWLKSGQGEVVANANVKSALKYYFDRPTCRLTADTDYVGNDIANKPSATADGCCAICINTPGCRAFSWSNNNGGTCWLKSKVTQGVYKAGVTSAQAYVVAPTTCPSISYGIDYPGNDIANKPSAYPEACCDICKATSGCRAWSWTNHNGGTCWLKSIAGIPQNNANVVSYLYLPSPTCSYEYDVDYVGNDIASVPSADYLNCCQLCHGRSGCKAVTWTDYNGGTCWLKTAKGATVAKTGAKSMTTVVIMT